MPRTFYTIDDLYMFCKSNNFTKFNSNEHGAPLIIQSVETFESAEYSKDGLLDVKLKACHVGKNRNGSAISEENMNKYKDSFKGRPILGSIFKSDTGFYEFHSHDMTIDEDGNLEYIEQPVGVISQLKDPYLEYDKNNDKTYLMVEGHVFEDYSHAAEILQRRRTCKCSVEIAVEEMSYNADEDYLSIDAFSFRGVTILGYEQDGTTEIQEGMEGSKITIDSFSEKNNSMFSASCQEKLIETLEKLNDTLSALAINNNQEGKEVSEMSHFEELLERYGITVEQCNFEYEGLTDEELDTLFEEHFGNTETAEEVVEEVVEECSAEELTDDESGNDDEGVVEEEFTEEVSEEEISEEEVSEEETFEEDVESSNFSVEDVVISFRISHEDVRFGIQNLLNAMNGDAHYYVVNSVYDGYFYYEDWMNNDAFKQSYKMRKDVISFSGDPEPVYREFVTQAEKDELEAMRKNYAALKEFKEQYDAAQLKAEKDAIFASAEYAEIVDSDEFKALIADAEKYSVDELKVEADLIFAASMKKKFAFEAHKPEKKHSVGMNFNAKPNKRKQAYGGIFSND